MYIQTHTYVKTNKEKEPMNLKNSKVGIQGKVWREKKEGTNDVIISQSQKTSKDF